MYRRSSNPYPTLQGFSDLDWAGDRDRRKSTSGYVFFLNGCPITYRSRKQSSTALSSCEAETIAGSQAASEAIWLRNVLDELGFSQTWATTLCQDNQGAIAFSSNETNHSKMKHIALREHFIREAVSDGHITCSYVQSSNNVADLFTKALGKMKFVELRTKSCCIAKPVNLVPSEGGIRAPVSRLGTHPVPFSVSPRTNI